MVLEYKKGTLMGSKEILQPVSFHNFISHMLLSASMSKGICIKYFFSIYFVKSLPISILPQAAKLWPVPLLLGRTLRHVTQIWRCSLLIAGSSFEVKAEESRFGHCYGSLVALLLPFIIIVRSPKVFHSSNCSWQSYYIPIQQKTSQSKNNLLFSSCLTSLQ